MDETDIIENEIPEEAIRQSALIYGSGSPLHRLLKIGEEYKKANCVPLFLALPHGNAIKVMPREMYGRKPN